MRSLSAFIIERLSGGEIGLCGAAGENQASLRLGRTGECARPQVFFTPAYVEDRNSPQAHLWFQLKAKS